MAKFKVIVSDPQTGASNVVELEETRATPLIGRRVGETIDGTVVNLAGYKTQITGGSDKDGFPMNPSVHGGVRRRVVLSGGVGFNPSDKGLRKRKTIRGNIITDEIVQINLKIVERPKGAKGIEKPQPKQEKKEEAESAESKPEEAKPTV
jgi:small subunit ribosomal protein S6e